MTMTGRTEVAFLAERILDDLRMIPRAYALLDRLIANAGARQRRARNRPRKIAGDVAEADARRHRLLRAAGHAPWRRRHRGGISRLDLCDVIFDDADIAALKLFTADPHHGAIAAEALDIIRQCRHIQALLYVEELNVAA